MGHPIPRIARVGALVVLWVLLSASVGHAQPTPPANSADADEATRAGVYLDDSLEAADELARAKRFVEAEQWNDAADLMLKTAGRFAKHLIRHDAGLYVNVAEYVNRRVADWPAPGLAAYRRLCNSAAQLAADTAIADRSLPALLDVTERYFCTTHARRSAEVAAELALEAGRFDLAADLYTRLLRQHPDRQEQTVALESKLALVHAWAGRAESARRLVDKVREASPEHRVGWGQTWRPIDEAIDAEVQPSLADPGDEAHAFAWPLYGGNSTRNRSVVSRAQARAALWRVDGIAPDAAPNSQRRSSAAVQGGSYLNQHVVVGNGIIYLHDADTVRAIRAGNGQDAWRPYQAEGLVVSRREFARSSAPPPFYAPTLSGDRLYVRLGGDPPTSRRSVAESILICLDAHTGRLVWRMGRKELGPRFARTYFDGSPLVADGKLYVIARRRRSVGFEDAYLLQLDAETGRLDWQTHLASGSVGGFGSPRPTVAVPAIIGQQIYVCTNLGVVVAVSLHNGRVRWARLYGSRPASRAQWWSQSYRQPMRPWQYDPVRAWDGRVVVKPLDADRLLVLDPGTGVLEKELHLDSLQNLRYILGISENRLYGVGNQVFSWDLKRDREVWSRPLPAGKAYGRGCMTTTHLLVPTDEGLYRFPLDGSTPDGRSWDGENEGGNILATPDQILVAGNDHLSAYARKEAALARLQTRVAAAPDDPGRHLDLADLAFRVEEYELGLTSLDAAAERAGGYALILEPSVKHRVFRNCLHFADTLLRLDPPRRGAALALYFKAGQCAPDAEGHVEFRRKLAALHTSAGQYARAVARWQQILLDRSLGSTVIQDLAGKTVAARTLAEQAIDHLIRRHGPAVYERFEDQARALLAAGRDGGDLELFERVADQYPNARSAPAALVAWGNALREARRPLEAARIYRRAITRYRDAVHAPDVMRWLSDSYREADQPLTAAAWLARAEREFPQARITVDGERLRFAEYRQHTLGVAVYRERSTPRIELALKPAGSHTFDKPIELIEPAPTTDVNARWDFLAVYADDHLTVVEPTSGRSWWPVPVPCPLKPRLLGSSDTAAVFATDFQVFSVQLDTGQVLWRVGDYPAKLGNAAVDPEEHKALAFAGFGSFDGRVVAARANGEVLCLDIESGRRRWRTRLDEQLTDGVVGSEELVVCRARSGRTHRFIALDAESGDRLQRLDLEGNERSIWFDVSLDGTLVVATARSLRAFEPFTGERLWSEPHRRTQVANSLALTLDGVYLSQDGRHLIKRDLSDGQALWTSALIDLAHGSSQTLTTTLHRNRVIVASKKAIVNLDPTDGSVSWEGTTEGDPSLDYRFVTPSYVIAVDVQRPPRGRGRRNLRQRTLKAYFYDCRDESGIIPDNGTADLGTFEQLKTVTLRDHVLIVQDAQTLHFFTDPSIAPPEDHPAGATQPAVDPDE